jgi:hypothetical protein
MSSPIKDVIFEQKFIRPVKFDGKDSKEIFLRRVAGCCFYIIIDKYEWQN